MILRLLNWQGIAGMAASLGLAILLLFQKAETRHWKKESAGFEQLYHQGQAAFATTVANYRAAADQARAADQANAMRVAADQQAINQRTEDEFETRLAAARAAAQRLRVSAQAAADPGIRGNAPVPLVSASADSTAQTASQDRLPPADALTATEQAIQLDELIKWVRAQAAVDNNPKPVASHPGD
jgi:ribosome assembly protein YihI (activator of Der GTPase)